MVVIICVIVLVVAVSLYDYFTTRRWQLITSVSRNELVFEGRNKEYGAYVIRRDYDKRMMIIMFSLIGFIGLTYGTYEIIKHLPKDKVEAPPVDTSTFAVAAPPIDEEVPPPPPEDIPPPVEKTIAFMPPVVVDIPVEDEIPLQEDMEDTKASTDTQDGSDDSFAPPVIGEEKPPVVEEKPEEVFTFVEEEAEFPGGMQAMLKFLGEHVVYPDEAVEQQIQGKVFVKFVVEKSGQVSNVSVARGMSGCPKCDANAVKAVREMPNWKPGKNGGKPVRQYYQIPVSFVLE